MARPPGIDDRLARHPALRVRRHRGILWGAVALAGIVLVGWALLLANAQEIAQQFATYQDGAMTIRQRVGSRFGVPIGLIFLPLLAVSFVVSGFALSRRWQRIDTGTMLRRWYRGSFNITVESAAAFQALLRSRSAETIGAMNPSTERGGVIVEAWAAGADRVGYVGVYAFGLKTDPGWELVEFSGSHFDDFATLFPRPERLVD